jgi:hypothetical protein
MPVIDCYNSDRGDAERHTGYVRPSYRSTLIWLRRSTWNNPSVDCETAGATRKQSDSLQMLELGEFCRNLRRREHEEPPFETQERGSGIRQLPIGPDRANGDNLGRSSLERGQRFESRVFDGHLLELECSHDFPEERGLSRLGLDHRQGSRGTDDSQWNRW